MDQPTGKAAQGRASDWPRGSMLANFSEAARADLLTLGTMVEFPAGATMLRQGDRSTHLFVLVAGLAKVSADTMDGDSVLLAVRVAGDAVGELASLDNGPRLATVSAAGLVRARRISGCDFADFLERHQSAARATLRSVTAKLRWATRRRVDFGSFPVSVRLARLLVELAAEHGCPTEQGLAVGVPLSQPELAALIGAAEPSVSRALRELRVQGALVTGYRQYVITDQEALRRHGRLHEVDELT